MKGREAYPDEELRRRIMDFIMVAGQTLLENGAEVFRVEQTMEIMARSFHLREFHVYVLTNGIFASAGTAEISEVRNVPVRTTHLGRVAAVNALSREIAETNMSLGEAEYRLAAAQRIPFPKDWVQLVSGMGGAFSFAMIFGGLMCQGFSWEELTSNYYNEKNYLETQDCGQRMASQVNKVRNALSDGKPFLTKGKLDKTKLVDITRLDAKTSQQNPATTYTVEDLLELKDNGLWDEFQDAIWSADYGIYEEYDEDDEEYYEDGEYDEDDNENDTSPTEDVDISDYTPRFRYLYNYARDFETVLPESGETLAEYARTNPKKVSLFELYQQLSNAIDQLSSYQSAIKMDDKTNVIFMVQNLDNKAVYTNVSEWADGNVDPKSLEDLMEDVPVFVAEREDGKLKDVSDNGTDAGKWIYNYFQNDPVTGKNEKIIVSVDVSFPYSDEVSAAYAAYENYAGWGNGLVVGMIISFVAGILFLLVITLQSGLVCRDREVHTMPADRIPAEVMLAICGMALIGMVGIAGLGLTGSGNPTDGFWLTVITTGEILGAAVFLGAYLSVIRRWKAKKLWRSSFCYTIVKSCKKVYMARTTSGRMIVAFVGLVLMNYLLAALFGGFGLILLFLADGVVLLYMIRENAGRQVIYDGLARLASGQLDYKIDEKDLTGDNRQMLSTV